ncbi:MAG: trypsin-like serine protease, partial [Thermoguttaceae bacterium]|nr:trypsin-like serine protease [Thermoguttaceae bacterium]
MNASKDPARETVDENGVPVEEVNTGKLSYGVNRWEAVVTFADGKEPTDGNYTLVCSAMVQDIARNALVSNGYDPAGGDAGYDGKDWSLDFGVVRLDEALGFHYNAGFPRNNYIPEIYVQYDDGVVDTDDLNAYAPIEHDPNSSLAQDTRYTINEEDSNDQGPNNATAVASDSNGNYVVTWVDTIETLDEEAGTKVVTKTVWAKAYRRLYVVDDDGVRKQIIDENTAVTVKVYEDSATFVLSDGKWVLPKGATFSDPRQASVAMDDKGDFAVVWDMITEDGDGSRDVYMRKYAFNGGALKLNGVTDMLMVNVHDSKDQQNASVAMDSDGDIVVVWESYRQDGEGWGIFGRRFLTNGQSYGFVNTVQSIEFSDSIDMIGDTLDLTWTDPKTGARQTVTAYLGIEMKANADAIKAALMTLVDSAGKQVFDADDLKVTVASVGVIKIEFVGKYTAQYVDALKVKANRAVTEDAKPLRANLEVLQMGASGVEFSVNETTANNQRFPSIGMASDGSFVVSWTSWGQSFVDEDGVVTGDSALESDIYARKFPSNHVVVQRSASADELAIATGYIDANQKVITTDNVAAHEVYGGEYKGEYDGVCMITIGDAAENGTTSGTTGTTSGTTNGGDVEGIGTGSLLKTGQHVLTAAHVVCDDDGTPIDPLEEEVYCTFETASGRIRIPVLAITVHESYDGVVGGYGADLAVLTLAHPAPSSIQGYDLYTGSDELGQTITFVGYGTYGQTSDTEDEIADRRYGVKHYGNNVYELTGPTFQDSLNPNVLVYDFDDGTAANDYFGTYYGVVNRGLGRDEAMTAPGDSGSPSFIRGMIAGVCSWGTDFDEDESYGPGNYQVDVRVSVYADWIYDVIMSGLGGEFLVNTDEPVVNITIDDEGGTTAEVTQVYSPWQAGVQKWSDVAMDANGNFVITWTGYNQDRNGDSLTGPSRNGLGGVFGRAFGSDPTSALVVGGEVFQVNTFTAYDQIHSKVAMDRDGDFIVVYESWQDPANRDNSDEITNFGVFARRYNLNLDLQVTTEEENNTTTGNNGTTTGTTTGSTTATNDETVTISGVEAKPIGSEFRVNHLVDSDHVEEDQLGPSVAVDANGDAVFVWTDKNDPANTVRDANGRAIVTYTVAGDPEVKTGMEVISLVETRSLVSPEDDTPPYVVRANAIYGPDGEERQVSLYANNVAFRSGNGPTELVYQFNEYMLTDQMLYDLSTGYYDQIIDGTYHYLGNTLSENQNRYSVINPQNWTLTYNDGTRPRNANSFIDDIYYGYNAAVAGGAMSSEYSTNAYELLIKFDELPLPDGTYILTLHQDVTDTALNGLDG